MDTQLTGKSNKKVKALVISFIALVFLVLAWVVFKQKPTLRIERKNIQISEVKMDYFQQYIAFQASVEPYRSTFINIVETGSVQQVYVNNGDLVQKGDSLIKLLNPSLEYNFIVQENSLIDQMNTINVNIMNIRSSSLNLTKDLISIEHDYKTAQLQYDLHQKLYQQEVLSQSDWERTQEAFRYQNERKLLFEQSIANDRHTNEVQIRQLQRSLEVLQGSLQKLRNNQQNLLVRAPMSGRLSSFDAVLGKTYVQGESVGKVDDLSGYKLLAKVDEFYIDKIHVGQLGQIESNDITSSVEVTKIIPEVNQGKFELELEFVDTQPEHLKLGASFGVRLFLSVKQKSLLLSKGSFSIDTNAKWVYVVKDGKAVRRNIEVGRENPSYYEIISGLEQAEQVITSSYKNYLNVEILNIEQ